MPSLAACLLNLQCIAYALKNQHGIHCAFAAYENDSKDATLSYLQVWLRYAQCFQPRSVISERNVHKRLKARTARIAYARNKLMEWAREHCHTCRAIVIIDLDNVNAYVDIDAAVRYIVQRVRGNGNDVAAVTCASQRDDPYDRWATRWKGMPDVCYNSFASKLCPYNSAPHNNVLTSCFGGFAVYAPTVLEQTYDGSCVATSVCLDNQECEHVRVNEALQKAGGLITIAKDLRNLGYDSYRESSAQQLAAPISSRALPHCVYSWNTTYALASTEHRVRPGIFRDALRKHEPHFVWVRAGTPLPHNNALDIDMFAREGIPALRSPIVLLTGDGDMDVPHDVKPNTLRAILECPFVVAWYAQNCVQPGEKLHVLPIGLNSRYPAPKVPAPLPHMPKVYADVCLTESDTRRIQLGRVPTGCSRAEARIGLQRIEHVTIPAARLSRKQLYDAYRAHSHVLCCAGNGADTHRAWEVLHVGRIPIVEDNVMNRQLFQHHSVLYAHNLVQAASNMKVLTRSLQMCRRTPRFGTPSTAMCLAPCLDAMDAYLVKHHYRTPFAKTDIQHEMRARPMTSVLPYALLLIVVIAIVVSMRRRDRCAS